MLPPGPVRPVLPAGMVTQIVEPSHSVPLACDEFNPKSSKSCTFKTHKCLNSPAFARPGVDSPKQG